MKIISEVWIRCIAMYIGIPAFGITIALVMQKLFDINCFWVIPLATIIAVICSALYKLRVLMKNRDIVPENDQQQRQLMVFTWAIPLEFLTVIVAAMIVFKG